MSLLSDLLSEQEAERLRETEREMNRPSPLFVQTVSRVAERLGLEPERALAGEGIRLGATIFHAMHFGKSDPDALTLFIQMGSIRADDEAGLLRMLLEQNLAARTCDTFFGVMPGTDIVILRSRIDLAKAADPAAAVLEYIAAFARQSVAIAEMAKAGSELAQLLAESNEAGDAARASE